MDYEYLVGTAERKCRTWVNRTESAEDADDAGTSVLVTRGSQAGVIVGESRLTRGRLLLFLLLGLLLHVFLELVHVVRDEQEGVVEGLVGLVLRVVGVVLAQRVQAGQQLVGVQHGSSPSRLRSCNHPSRSFYDDR